MRCFSVSALVAFAAAASPHDSLGLESGYLSFDLKNYRVQLVKDSQTLASIRPHGIVDFDFQPNKTLLEHRAGNGQHHTGDVIFRYRREGEATYSHHDTALLRKPVRPLSKTDNATLASASLQPTLGNSSIQVTRTWANKGGDLTLSFRITNDFNAALEIGGFGFPLTSDSIFTGLTAIEINAHKSLIDPYIGKDAGYAQFTRINGEGPALIVTPLSKESSFEAWDFLVEDTQTDVQYQSANFEGYYQWMTLSQAYATKEWNASTPWNSPTSKILRPGQSMMVGVRFTIVDEIDGIEDAARSVGLPVAKGIPGYVIPSDLEAQLHLYSDSDVDNITTEPANALIFTKVHSGKYIVQAAEKFLGRVRATITYGCGKQQTLFYHISRPGPATISAVGQYLNDKHWWTNESDPFGRAPSFMTVDHSIGDGGELFTQDYLARAWLTGECHEAGASWYTMALKQIAQPDAIQVAKLEEFVKKVMWETIQLPNFAVRQSIFYYEPNKTDYVYNPAYPWSYDGVNYSVSWSKERAYATTRSYGYTYPATTYWALYRVGRTHPSMLKERTWQWYLSQAFETLVYCFKETNGTHLQPLWNVGLMGETAFGELLKDLFREGWDEKAERLEALMRARSDDWAETEIPFGSELGWDCTGEEGVYYFSQYFGDEATVNKTIRTITGYDPVLPHWGYNGNARRYWDFQFDGKIDRMERQIHHYGSSLNALPILEHIRSSPAHTSQHLYRLAFGGHTAALSNVHEDGFASTAFHSWAETLEWDSYTGDYGPAFAGLVLGAACYVTQDVDFGLVAYNGEIGSHGEGAEEGYKVWPKDALRRRLYIQTLDLWIELDAGAIESALVADSSVALKLLAGPTEDAESANKAIIWLNQSFHVEDSAWKVQGTNKTEVNKERGGWSVLLDPQLTHVLISK